MCNAFGIPRLFHFRCFPSLIRKQRPARTGNTHGIAPDVSMMSPTNLKFVRQNFSLWDLIPHVYFPKPNAICGQQRLVTGSQRTHKQS